MLQSGTGRRRPKDRRKVIVDGQTLGVHIRSELNYRRCSENLIIQIAAHQWEVSSIKNKMACLMWSFYVFILTHYACILALNLMWVYFRGRGRQLLRTTLRPGRIQLVRARLLIHPTTRNDLARPRLFAGGTNSPV